MEGRSSVTAKPTTKNQRAIRRAIRLHLLELKMVSDMTNAQQLNLVEALPEGDPLRLRAEAALTRFLDSEAVDETELAPLHRAWLDAVILCRRRIQ